MKRRSTRRRTLNPECLESRHLLAAGPLLHTHNENELAIVNVSTGDIETLANMDGFEIGQDDRMSDIAFGPDGTLYGITRDWLYEIHPVSGELTSIGGHGIPNANALIHDRNGRLLAMSRTSDEVFRLNISGDTLGDTTRFATLSGLEEGEGSSGDITFLNSELVVATTNDRLIWYRFDVNPDRPRVVREVALADLGIEEIYGLAVYNDTLFATGEDGVIRFDLTNALPSANIVAVDEAFGDLRGAAHYAEADGPVPVGTLSGVKWRDVNGDGIQQVTEETLCDWTVYIDENLNGVLDPDEPVDRTDALGRYHFFGLEPGLYTVDEVVTDTTQAWEQTFPEVEHRHLVGDYTFATPSARNDLFHDGGLPDMTASFVSLTGGDARFNNANSFLDLPVPLGADPFTIAIDASYSTNIGSELFLVSQRASDATEDQDFSLSASATRDLSSSFCNADGTCTEVELDSIETGRHEYAITWDGENVGIFVDGVLLTREVTGQLPDIDGTSVRFGDPFDDATRASLQGPVHGIRIFNNALNESDLVDAFTDVKLPTAYSAYVNDVAGIDTLDFGNRVRVAPDGPEIEVRRDADDGANVATGSSIDLGLGATVEEALSIELFVNNLGDEPLDLNTVDVSDGFEITGNLASQVAAGGTTSFFVTVTDNTPGVKNGQITIANNDVDENPYIINLTAEVIELDNRPREVLVNTTAGTLLKVDKLTGITETLVSDLPNINDIAHHPTEQLLVGIGPSFVFEIDINTKTTTPLFTHGLTNQTALAFSPFGELFSAGSNIHKIDLVGETSSFFATGGPTAAGDLEFLGTEMLLSTTQDKLYRVADGQSTLIGESAVTLNGLAAVDADTLFGLSSNQAFTVDSETAVLNPQFSFGFIAIDGATYLPPFEVERNPLDVNDDGVVTAFDAILVINELNLREFSDPNTQRLIRPTVAPTLFPDITGDGFIQAIDVLMIVNFLNGV